ncbi:hypothetical protein D8674_013546 [Pyrus ussuriensis x Pyrus communis]|uniref:Uncharacterized protein n=1 Tax=Pyrus ussuriensis x Pyrus communis TaxID=2448454 RepID=A0A5N5GRB1_9ROSA|nr:hypothetical protein D8674_013546 [Pyrus ussuriensis x Pyrus communis]
MRAAIESNSKDEDLENDAVSYPNKVQKKLIQLKLKLCSINHTLVLISAASTMLLCSRFQDSLPLEAPGIYSLNKFDVSIPLVLLCTEN